MSRSEAKAEKEKEKAKKKGGYLNLAIMVLCAAVFIFALSKIVGILLEYKEASDLYNGATESFVKTEWVPIEVEKEVFEEHEIFSVDFDALKEANDDVVGWIYIPNSSINYPVLKCKNNDQYLYQSYLKKYLTAGSIFLDFRCTPDLQDDSTVIYGHNMKDGAMFGSLKKYKDESYFKSHSYMYLFKDDNTVNVYKAVSQGKADIWGPVYELPKERTDANDQVVLSTCTGDGNYDYRYTVVYDFIENVPAAEAQIWKTTAPEE